MRRSSLLLLLLALPLVLVFSGSAPLQAAPAPPATEPLNLLVNGSFEIGDYSPDGTPEPWARNAWDPSRVDLTWDAAEAQSGDKSVKISAATPNDASWTQTVPVEPHTQYLLSGWIKTENVVPESEGGGAGANLSLVGTWDHSPGLLGTNDWTYIIYGFNSGDQTTVTIGARLGYWSDTTSGTAWFDNLRLAPVQLADPHPRWKILVLIYETTDFTFTDQSGVSHHVVSRTEPWEHEKAAYEATMFVKQDIPLLTSGNMLPLITVRHPERPLSTLSPSGEGWWPAPQDTATERDPAFDSVIVIWDPRTYDDETGEFFWIGYMAGLTSPMGLGQTYIAMTIEATQDGHRNVFKHEFGHSILFYHDALGLVPKPTVSNHAEEDDYVHCPTGEPYVWEDETDANPIPNSIYNNNSGFTHDYYSGTTATPDHPTHCLGITPEAWAYGGPVSHVSANMLANAGFEADADGDGTPDGWLGARNFGRSDEYAREGAYAGIFDGSRGRNGAATQVVGAVTPGDYSFAGWVRIPTAQDRFLFTIQVRWQNAEGATIGIDEVKTLGPDAGGQGTWEAVTATLHAPAGTAQAQLYLATTGLRGQLYIDQLLLMPGVLY